MYFGGPWLLVGAGVAVPLRRWPVVGLVMGCLVSWVVYAGEVSWPPRSLATAAAAIVVLTRMSRRPAVWWGAMAIVAAGTAFTWVRPLWSQVAAGAAVWTGLAMLGEGMAARPARGAWGVVGIAGLFGSLLLALTGSARLGAEAALVAIPALGLVGCELDAAAGRAVALLLGMAWTQGVLFSELGPWICVPVACLLALRVGHSDSPAAGWQAMAAAAGIGILGSAPLLVDFVRNPPF